MKFRDRAAGRDAADAVGGFLREPQRAVGAGGDADRHGGARRQRELGKRLAVRIEAADLRGAVLAEPQRAVGPLDRDIGLRVRARNLVLANRHPSRAHCLAFMAMRRPIPSGTGRRSCAAFICLSRRITLSGNAVVFFATMSTLSAMFSDVAESQPCAA